MSNDPTPVGKSQFNGPFNTIKQIATMAQCKQNKLLQMQHYVLKMKDFNMCISKFSYLYCICTCLS